MNFDYPKPTITAELDYEALRSQRIAAFLEAWETHRQQDPTLPEYDVQMLETDPAVVALEVAAYGDLYFTGRTNDVARATLLTDFAIGEDLDLHGAATRTPAHPNGLARFSGEEDSDYRARIIEARAGTSAAGPDEWWLTQARAADARVRSIGLDYRGQGQLNVYLLARDHGGVPDQAMLDAVTARLNRPDVRPRNVVPAVLSAVIEEVDVVADVWLLPDTAEARLEQQEAAALAAASSQQSLDTDLTHHYLRRLMDSADIYKIEIVSPAADLVADPSRAYSVRSITARLAGRAK